MNWHVVWNVILIRQLYTVVHQNKKERAVHYRVNVKSIIKSIRFTCGLKEARLDAPSTHVAVYSKRQIQHLIIGACRI